MSEVAIIDSGGANLASLVFALDRLGVRAAVTSDAREITAATRILLPGVGAAPDAMQRLRACGVAEVLPQLKQPVLGICLGMQLLFERSEEGPSNCLGVIPGRITRLSAAAGRPVPHMGWNQLNLRREDPLLEGIAEGEYFYFVHSYAATPTETSLATSQYGAEIPAVVRHANFWGTQFHPERSGAAGARLLANFLRLN
jgi:glutamine amidotransferase